MEDVGRGPMLVEEVLEMRCWVSFPNMGFPNMGGSSPGCHFYRQAVGCVGPTAVFGMASIVPVGRLADLEHGSGSLMTAGSGSRGG